MDNINIISRKILNPLNIFIYSLDTDRSMRNLVETINLHPEVLYAEPAYRVHTNETIPNDEFYNQLWGMENIDASLAWDSEQGSQDVIIGVIDTGIDYNHPDLVDNRWINENEIPDNGIDDDGNGYVDDVYGYDFINNDGDPFDDNLHGTHCAGTIAGVGNNEIGVTGVSWNSKVAALKFLGYDGFGDSADAAEAQLYATMMGFHLTSNSWGGGPFSQVILDAINYSDMLFIVAAGNDYGNNNDINSDNKKNKEVKNVTTNKNKI